MDSGMSAGQIIRYSSLKLIFEFIGTMFLTILFNCSQKYSQFATTQVALLFGLWVLVIFGFKISGSHYNPAISLAFMLRRDVGNFPRPLGIAYIIVQIIGGFVGALISWFLMLGLSDSGIQAGRISLTADSLFF
jgi:glycerol uptake facilitator-like aquaporin